jgi:hypothetical protein
MRKSATVTIEAKGRDHGKVFQIDEMPASRAEKWATRAMLALTRAGVEIPENVGDMGMAAIAAMGLHAIGNLSFADAEPLLDEMMGCVRFIPDPSQPKVVRALLEDDIDEVATRLFLRSEVVALHVGFSISGELSKIRARPLKLPN